jgi:hypothetical protein
MQETEYRKREEIKSGLRWQNNIESDRKENE